MISIAWARTADVAAPHVHILILIPDVSQPRDRYVNYLSHVRRLGRFATNSSHCQIRAERRESVPHGVQRDGCLYFLMADQNRLHQIWNAARVQHGIVTSHNANDRYGVLKLVLSTAGHGRSEPDAFL